MACKATTANIEKRICEILIEYPVSQEDITTISSSEEERSRFINAYIAGVSPTVQQYLDSESNGFKARNFTTMMLSVIRTRLESITKKS